MFTPDRNLIYIYRWCRYMWQIVRVQWLIYTVRDVRRYGRRSTYREPRNFTTAVQHTFLVHSCRHRCRKSRRWAQRRAVNSNCMPNAHLQMSRANRSAGHKASSSRGVLVSPQLQKYVKSMTHRRTWIIFRSSISQRWDIRSGCTIILYSIACLKQQRLLQQNSTKGTRTEKTGSLILINQSNRWQKWPVVYKENLTIAPGGSVIVRVCLWRGREGRQVREREDWKRGSGTRRSGKRGTRMYAFVLMYIKS